MSKSWVAALAVLALGGTALAADPEPIVVGAPISLSGALAENGQLMVAGLELAVKQVNEAGGIKALGGAKLQLVTADTSSDNPTQAASVTSRLIQQDHAAVLAGCVSSSMTLSAQVEAERAEVPIITTSYADKLVDRGYKYTFKISLPTSSMLEYMIDYASDLIKDTTGSAPKRIQAVVGSDASSQGMAASIGKIGAARSLDVIDTLTFQNNLTDATPIITTILQAKPDLIVTSGFPQDTVLVLRALRGVGINTPAVTLSSSVGNNEMGRALGDGGRGYMGVESWMWDLTIPGNTEMVERFKKDYPNLSYPPAYEQLGQGYAAGLLIRDAIEQAGSADPKKIRDAIAGMDGKTPLPGERMVFDTKGLNATLVPVMAMWMNGELRTVWPKKYQTVQPKF